MVKQAHVNAHVVTCKIFNRAWMRQARCKAILTRMPHHKSINLGKSKAMLTKRHCKGDTLVHATGISTTINSRLVESTIHLDLSFMNSYPCIKYESNLF